MTNRGYTTGKTGPQGTEVFDLDDVNKMIAREIVESRAENANMPALIGVSNDTIGHQFILRNNKIKVGRRASCDIVLTEPSVSSVHAQIIYDRNEWKVFNLLSSNGTFVNTKKVTESTIKMGDLIAFGGSEFVFSMVVDDAPDDGKNSNNQFALIAGGSALVLGLVLFLLI
ncbi:MAG: FHA domain-containing protein [Enterobacterales bacterium]|nr:FHA domain-containing protein [Enterobacterales bacterium]